MNIQDLFPPQSASNVAQPKKQLGQDDFMKLLVAQMNNQDPSNPADNGQFLAQIAQISMVSGIDKLGTSFDGVASGFYTQQAMQASSLVGHSVLAESNVVALDDGGSVEGMVDVPEFAQGLNIQVRDPEGALIKTIDTASYKPGTNAIHWDGRNERGELQAPGDYVVTATALVDGKQEAVPLLLYNTVHSVNMSPDRTAVQLELAGQRRINFSQVFQYR